jgi:hypothetical protein
VNVGAGICEAVLWYFRLLVRTRHKQQLTSGQEYFLLFGARLRMSALLQQILQWLCPHRFSWPHSGIHGQDYQVCLHCGTAFEHDVTKMRRTKRLDLFTGAMSPRR